MSAIVITGLGAVSPAGWGVASMRAALARGEPLPATPLARPGWTTPLAVRRVPAPQPRPWFFAHSRLRRTSPISQFAVGAACEALGLTAAPAGPLTSLGVVCCVMSGCVNYSRRFYDEALRDPVTASPLVFPETVFNAPSSHLASLLGATSLNYTLIGDPGVFLQGLALAAHWLTAGDVDSCLVVGAEEADWLTADALHLFARDARPAEGAGAVLLTRQPTPLPNALRLAAITDTHGFQTNAGRVVAARAMRQQLPPPTATSLLCDGLQGSPKLDHAEASALRDWPGPRLSPKQILGEGFAAASAWQCVAALDLLAHAPHDSATVTVVGLNQQALAARFER